jgi:hypothetical protein
MVAICDLLESSSRTATHFANPLFHPAVQGLKKALPDYVEKHPEVAPSIKEAIRSRLEQLFRQPAFA